VILSSVVTSCLVEELIGGKRPSTISEDMRIINSRQWRTLRLGGNSITCYYRLLLLFPQYLYISPNRVSINDAINLSMISLSTLRTSVRLVNNYQAMIRLDGTPFSFHAPLLYNIQLGFISPSDLDDLPAQRVRMPDRRSGKGLWTGYLKCDVRWRSKWFLHLTDQTSA
jgi:hypothetical protein